MRTRLASAVLLALLTAVVATGVALAQWPTTCVDLNDIAEAHLDNHGNVGIYQRVFGDAAEAACQRDHQHDGRRQVTRQRRQDRAHVRAVLSAPA